jgi:hypothetical protein
MFRVIVRRCHSSIGDHTYNRFPPNMIVNHIGKPNLYCPHVSIVCIIGLSKELLDFLEKVLQAYDWCLFKLDALDYGGPARFRVFFIGALRGRLKVPFSDWAPYLRQLRTPRGPSASSQLGPSATSISGVAALRAMSSHYK